MGRGLVEPVNDFRLTNPASHPELLDELANDFREHDCDLRDTIRQIVTSDAYARRSQPAAGDPTDGRFYSHAMVRPLAPEVLADAISDVLDIKETYGDAAPGTRAIDLVDANVESRSLDVLGRCAGQTECESGAGSTGELSQQLHLMNGPLLNARIASQDGRLDRLLAADADAGAIIDEFYLVALGRRPSPAEQAFWRNHLRRNGHDAAEWRRKLEDFVWAILSCDEFTHIH